MASNIVGFEASIPKSIAELGKRVAVQEAIGTGTTLATEHRLPTPGEALETAAFGTVFGNPRSFLLNKAAQRRLLPLSTAKVEQEKGVQDASQNVPPATMGSDVPAQPAEGAQPVPVEESQPGIQPQAKEEAAPVLPVTPEAKPTPLTPDEQAIAQKQLAESQEPETPPPSTEAAPGKVVPAPIVQQKPETALTKTEITPEHIGFDQRFTEPPWRPISDEESASPTILGDIATKDARIEGSKVPISNTRRVLVLQSRDNKSPTVHLVSVYKSGRTGALAVDPDLATRGKPNKQLSTILTRYKPLYSILLTDPVKNFHQKFDSLQDFYGKFGDKAIELSRSSTGEAPTQVTEATVPEEPGSLLPTSAELGQAFRAAKAAHGPLTADAIRTAPVSQRQLVSAVKKITQHLLETEPNLEPKEAIARAIDILNEHAQSTQTTEAFTESIRRRLSGATGKGLEPDYEDIGHTGETALESRHDTSTGLPPGVKDGGQGFAAELMEASRRLGTLVKSNTRLRAGVEGRYRRAKIAQDDSIEVGDIQNQGTVAHEMGHDIDALLFPQANLADSQSSLGVRVGGNAKDHFNELVKVSELMRGPITGSKGHQKYRKRATELVADFFSLYAHDPEQARALAPKFTAGFETVLHGNKDAAETIRQLHAGNVEPVAPDAGQPGVAAPTGMPGAVPARPKATPVKRDAALAVAAEDLVKGEVRRYEAEVQGARVKADTWREDVPNRQARNDVGGFVEGIGNLEVPGDTIDVLKARMTPAMKELAKSYRFNIELQRQRINEYLRGSEQGEYLKFLEDYLPHFYANSKTPAGKNATARFIKESPNAKQRKIPTLKEAVDYGLTPISQDPAVLYETTARINWRVATNRKVLAELKGMQSGGDPIIVPAGQAPPGWPKSDNPLIQRVYARKTASGTMLWRGGAAIHPDAWRAVRMMLDTPTSGNLWAYDALNSLTRANAFAFALFHDVTLRSASLGAQMEWYNPLRGLFRLFERNPLTGELESLRSTRGVGKELLKDEQTVTDAALHGLRFAWTDSSTYQKQAIDFLDKAAARWRDTPYLGTGLRLARDLQHWRQEGLWRNTHDAYKIAAYEDLSAKALQGSPQGTDPKIVKQKVASLLNDAFGGQEWETKFWLSPVWRQRFSRFALAPDWTLSTLRSVPFVSDAFSVTRGQAPRIAGREPIPTAKEGVSGNIGRARFWGAELVALAAATLGAQYAIYQAFGKKEKGDHPWVWDNEIGQNRRVDATPLMRNMPWRDPKDPTRFYINLGKRPEEILNWFTSFDKQIMSKMSRPAAEIFRQITGSEGDMKAPWKRDHETFLESGPERVKSAANILIPFSLSGNQFALSLPFRKGMTKYKAEQAYESAYELAAEPSRVRSLLRGQTQDTDLLLDQITDAAQANGVEPKSVQKRAISFVRGKYYDQYFKALKNNDDAKMEKAANALLNLRAGQVQIDRAVARKTKMEVPQ